MAMYGPKLKQPASIRIWWALAFNGKGLINGSRLGSLDSGVNSYG